MTNNSPHTTSSEKDSRSSIERVGGYLHRVVPVFDVTGKIISYSLKPFMVEFKLRDVLQVIVGSVILAIPVAFTEEVWVLSQELPFKNVIWLSVLSVVFVALFVYYNFYKNNLTKYWKEYLKRVISVYMISLAVVALILIIIGKFPWEANRLVAIKRMIIVAFPASMSGIISDTIK